MKGLSTLIKLHKRTLDELRRSMASLENQKEQLQLAIKKMQEELEAELVLAGKQPEMANFFGEFSKRIKTRQDMLRQEIRSLDTQIIKLNDEIAAAFAELKKFEIAKENAMRRAREEEARKDTLMLDELAGQQFQRKKE